MGEMRKSCNYELVWKNIQSKIDEFKSIKDIANNEKCDRITISRVMQRHMSKDEYRKYVITSQVSNSKWDPNIFGPWIDELIQQGKPRSEIRKFFSDRKEAELVEKENFAEMSNNELKKTFILYNSSGNIKNGEEKYKEYVTKENRKIASWKRFGKIIPDLIKDLKENKLSLSKISVKYGRIADNTIKKLRDDFFPEIAITYEEKKAKYRDKIIDLFRQDKKLGEIRESFEDKLPYVFTRSILEEEFGKDYFRKVTLKNSISGRLSKKLEKNKAKKDLAVSLVLKNQMKPKEVARKLDLRYRTVLTYLNKEKNNIVVNIPEYLMPFLRQIEYYIKNDKMRNAQGLIEKIYKQKLKEGEKLAIKQMIRRMKSD